MSPIELEALAAEARYLLQHGSGFVTQREMTKRLLEAVESVPADFWEAGYKAAVKDAYSRTNTPTLTGPRLMSGDRDELARELGPLTSSSYATAKAVDVLWAAGWRKKPERAAVIRALAKEQLLDGYSSGAVERLYGQQADAILALMDGPTETGDSE